MESSTARRVIAVYALGMVLFVGCSRSDSVEVMGTVTWNGAPLQDGEVLFFPEEPRVAPAGGRIKNGEFKFRTKLGKMRVEIQSARPTGKRDPVDGTPISELFIPVRYNEQSELKVDVTRDSKNRFDFPLVE